MQTMPSFIRRLLHSLKKAMSRDAYRPELHYMRGPGPASEKRCSGPQAKTGYDGDR